MTIEDDISFLRRIPTFSKFGFAALQIVAIGSEARRLHEGETLFEVGDVTDAGYVLQDGKLRLTTSDPHDPDPTIFGPGTLLGEVALLAETTWAATAVAVEPTTVIRITRNLFRKVLEGIPEAAVLMRQRMVERVIQADAELMQIRQVLERQIAISTALSAASRARSLR